MRIALALFIICASAAAQEAVRTARWMCSSAAIDGATLRDQAGHLHATLSGPVRTGDVHIALDGTQNRLIVASKFDSTRLPKTTLTLEAWVRVDLSLAWGGLICCIEDNGADENGFILGYRNAQFMLGIATQTTGKMTYLTGETRIREGRWNHVVGTYDGKTMRLYVDGKLDAKSTAQSGPIKYKPTHTFALGGYLDVNEYYGLTGRVHELRISNRSATASDIRSRWRATRGKLNDAVPSVEAPEPASTGWPGAMRDARRSGVTPETLKLPLKREWSHQRSRPRSAWPPPAKSSFWQQLKDIKPRNVWDHAFHPVAVEDDVLYGSSELDTVHCLDARSGAQRWTFRTGGPVRFAPHVIGNRVYVGSDDGFVYCIDRERGGQVWKRRLGPQDRLIPGNGRMISPWPVRTGIVAADGVVYATCGLFPREGCWAVALSADDGAEIWRAKVDASPQGYLLLSRRALFIPTGRGTPFALSRDSGTALGTFGGPGGAYALVAGGTLVSGRGNKGELSISDTFGRDQLAQFDGNRMVVTQSMSYLQSDTHLSALDRTRYLELIREIAQAKAEHGNANGRYRAVTDALEKKKPLKGEDGKTLTKRALSAEKASLRRRLLKLGARIDGLDTKLVACVPWKVETQHGDALVLAGKTLFAGGEGEIAAYDAKTGKKRWSRAVEGKALALAVSNGRLIVGTSEGRIIAFGRGQGRPPDHQPVTHANQDNPWLSTPGITLVIDPPEPIPLGPVDRRVESITSADLSRLPDRFANAVVIPNASGLTDEVKRVVRPWGGAVFVANSHEPIWTRGPLEGAGSWTHIYANPANTACSDDTLVGADLKLQWFGGPGPNPIIDRHLRTTPPLFREGRLFIPGHDRIIAVDGCNGAVLWEREVPGLSRTGAPYDGGHMAVGKDLLWIADG
ncbi:MAG: PQQ-binding-like beta-propeller repeat protein, partial [Planctomycetes bacterium]|nr:PQQ-binding-like beta-propeller repeat protein [Planctomycetota bacterium]